MQRELPARSCRRPPRSAGRPRGRRRQRRRASHASSIEQCPCRWSRRARCPRSATTSVASSSSTALKRALRSAASSAPESRKSRSALSIERACAPHRAPAKAGAVGERAVAREQTLVLPEIGIERGHLGQVDVVRVAQRGRVDHGVEMRDLPPGATEAVERVGERLDEVVPRRRRGQASRRDRRWRAPRAISASTAGLTCSGAISAKARQAREVEQRIRGRIDAWQVHGNGLGKEEGVGTARFSVIERGKVFGVPTLAQRPSNSSPLTQPRADPVARYIGQDFELLAARQFPKQRGPVQRDVAEGQARRAIEREPSIAQGEIAARMVRGIGDHHHVRMRRCARCAAIDSMRSRSARIVVVGIHVGAHDQRHTVAEQRQRGGDAAGDFQRRRFRASSDSVAPRDSRRSPSVASICWPRCATLMTISAKPAATRRSICQTMSGLPPGFEQRLGTQRRTAGACARRDPRRGSSLHRHQNVYPTDVGRASISSSSRASGRADRRSGRTRRADSP